MRGERPQVALVQARVGVLLRLDDPEDEVGERDDPIRLDPVRRLHRVEVREVEQHEPAELRRLPSRWRRRSSSQSRSASAAVPPHGRLSGRGRRPPPADGREVGPASALKSCDLPTPVGPASATTVDSRPSPSRTPAFATIARAASTASAPSRPSARSAASASAAIRPSSCRVMQRGGSRPARRGDARSCPPRAQRRRAARRTGPRRREQPLDALDEILARAGGERPDGLVAEDRLEHLLADRRRARPRRRSPPRSGRRYARRPRASRSVPPR